MAENKTQPTTADVDAFIAAVENDTRRADALAVRELMQRVTGEPAVMWGPAIIGFGSDHYRYDSGREGDAPRVAFSPRKAALVLYLLGCGADNDAALLARLGKHATSGKGCLYIKRLSDVDLGVLEEMVAESLANANQAYSISLPPKGEVPPKGA